MKLYIRPDHYQNWLEGRECNMGSTTGQTTEYANKDELIVYLYSKTEELQTAIDKDIKETSRLKSVENIGKAAREFSLVITKLQEAKMWLSEALKEISKI